MSPSFRIKKQDEWDAVRFVYNKNLYTIIGDERPDFSLTRNSDNYAIGVEVTRFYFHKASTRKPG
jgi:hypothetical protein